jgi:hypothetical protein
LHSKLGKEIEPYLFLGECNAELAHRGLQVESDLGCCRPATGSSSPEGSTYVAAMEPTSALQLAGNPQLVPIAGAARERLERAIERL